jgi:phospholipase/carboxylesterase
MQKPIQFLDDIQHPNDPDAYWVFMFHGFGADASDLKSLAEVLTPEGQKINWIFPNGIFTVPIGPMMTGRAWWPLTLSQLPTDWSLYSPPELAQLIPAIWKMIDSFKIPWNKIVLGGFSQGSMLATEIYLSAPETPAGLISFSGALIRKSDWTANLAKRQKEAEASGKSLKAFFSHGEMDQVLPSSGTQKLVQMFKTHGFQCDISSFRGGHEIPMPAIMKAQAYLSALP